jgi:hypothetical protein
VVVGVRVFVGVIVGVTVGVIVLVGVILGVGVGVGVVPYPNLYFPEFQIDSISDGVACLL